jgi:hypothetical protein
MQPEIETQPVDDSFPVVSNKVPQEMLNGLLFIASDSLDDDNYNLDGLHTYAAGAKNNANIFSQSQMLKAHDKEQFVSAQAGEINRLFWLSPLKLLTSQSKSLEFHLVLLS